MGQRTLRQPGECVAGRARVGLADHGGLLQQRRRGAHRLLALPGSLAKRHRLNPVGLDCRYHGCDSCLYAIASTGCYIICLLPVSINLLS